MPTPLFVIRALSEIRDGGLTDMQDQDSVAMLVTNQRAAEWINKVSYSQYEQALNDMILAESDDFLGTVDERDNEDDFGEQNEQSRYDAGFDW